ncbi:MAG: NAD(+)/NADH kinase [Candidatus Zixiibacteriota bacterium]
MKSIGIIANPKKPDVKETVQGIINWAEKNDVEFYLGQEMVSLVENKEKAFPRDELPRKAEVIISLGGDGTMLASARAVGKRGNPILGINLKSFGFITEIKANHLDKTLTRLLKKDFRIEQRMVLKAQIMDDDEPNLYALNDVVIDKGGVARLIQMHLYDNEEFICSYSADGLIVSTPTGSTAYSLASGGPIINPRLNAIIVSPICPHTLASRPIIFLENDRLKVKVESTGERDAVLTADGQVARPVKSGKSVVVEKAEYSINLIKFSESSFYDILRQKLHWGARPKGE